MIEVIKGGLYTTVQDYPGRVGYWHIGVPPSGPMDSFAFRIANRLVGNSKTEAGIEITGAGPTLKFEEDAVIACAGAVLSGEVEGQEIPWWEPFYVSKGSTITFNAVKGKGFRSYLAIRGGIDIPEYLGSKSTFAHGNFGGYEGRILKEGDTLKIGELKEENSSLKVQKNIKLSIVPEYTNEWEVGFLEGPHSSPDFFTEDFMKVFYDTEWKVSPNSNRLGYRLEGDVVPGFAREDGGEGGSHPSNMYDYPYSIGMVNMSGNTPIILTADGPSLGGFISIGAIAQSEMWKIGQAQPNDIIKFKKITIEEALSLEKWQNQIINSIQSPTVKK